MRPIITSILAFTIGLPLAATAQEAVTRTVEDSFENVSFAVESAIIGKGLVIDNISHVGEMLERTRADIGSDVVIFTNAEVYSFCSASVSRKVMEADPANIEFCPYGIFVYEAPSAPGQVVIGYRSFPEGPMKEVEALLEEIVADAAGG